MNENLTTMDVAKELVNLDEKIERMGKVIDKNVDIYDGNFKNVINAYDANFDKLIKYLNSLNKQANLNTILILGVIGYLAYKESDKVNNKINNVINKIKKHKSKKEAMDEMSEKITNMTMNGASDEELEEAVKRSKDVIDSYK